MALEVKLNNAGIAALLHDPGVVADLLGRAEAVAAAHGGDTSIDSEVYGSGRAIVHVTDEYPNSLFIEAHTGRLKRALSAAGATPNPKGSKWGPK